MTVCLLPRTKRKALSIFSCFGQKPPKQFYEFFLSFFPLRKKKEKRLLREKKRSDTERRTRQSNATRVRQTKRISSACFCINVTDIDSIGITLYVRLHLITATLYGISLSKLSLSLSRARASDECVNKQRLLREGDVQNVVSSDERIAVFVFKLSVDVFLFYRFERERERW